MKKKLITLLMALALGGLLIFGSGEPVENVVPLPDLSNPQAIAIDNRQIYIVEKTTFYIYSLNNFTLTKKFGKRGEGPREFMINLQSGRPLFMDVRTNAVVITSLGKVSFFSKGGDFIKELKLSTGSGDNFQPLGNGFAAQAITPGKGKLMRAINLYDEKLNPVKCVIKVEHHFQLGKGLSLLREPMDFLTIDNKLFVTWDADFKITVFNSEGDKIGSIVHPYERIKLTGFHKQEAINILKNHPGIKQYFDVLKPIRFPEYFPAIREMRIADGKLYIITYKEVNKRNECFMFDLKGKLLNKQFIPLKKSNALELYPFAFKNGFLYQLVEKGEDWELHISEL
jgi:hypothetical protein